MRKYRVNLKRILEKCFIDALTYYSTPINYRNGYSCCKSREREEKTKRTKCK